MKTHDNKEFTVDSLAYNGRCENCDAPRGKATVELVIVAAGELPKAAKLNSKFCKVCADLEHTVSTRKWFVDCQQEWIKEQLRRDKQRPGRME